MSANSPKLKTREAVKKLAPRIAAYWNTLEYCRHLGVQRHPRFGDFWIARVRKRGGGAYSQKRLARVDFENLDGVGYDGAVALAREWFSDSTVQAIASKPYPVGTNQQLRYSNLVFRV